MRTIRSRRPARVAVLAGAMVASGLATLGAAAAPAAPAASAAAGVPESPVEIFSENFENGQPPGAGDTDGVTMLNEYTGANGMTYTADEKWINKGQCNGVILSTQVSAPPTGFCGPGGWNALRALTEALGTLGGTDPQTNHAVAAWSATNATGLDSVQFHTADGIDVNSGRYYTFSVDTVATSCNAPNQPALKFYLLPENDPNKAVATFTSPIKPCDEDAIPGSSGVNVWGARVISNLPVLCSGTSLGIQLLDGNGGTNGNDGAFDNIQVLDVTPSLDKEFLPAQAEPGDPVRLRFTVTNTTDLAAKPGWSFVDELPDGMTVAADPDADTDCDNATPTATAGADSVGLTGDLGTGDVSCTFEVNVVTSGADTFTNDDVTTTGLLPPDAATLTVGDPVAFDCLSPRIFLAQNSPTRLDYLSPGSTDLTPVSPAAPGVTYNAIALNPQDNLIYALRVGGGATNGHLLRIDAAGTVADLGPTSPLTALNAGTFDDAGTYYAASSGGGPLRSIDIATRAVTSIPRTDNLALPADLAWVDGALWGQQDGRDEFIRIATDGTTTRFPTSGVIPDTVAAGAAWTYGNGNLGLSDNNSGTIYQIEIGDPNSPNPTFTVVSSQTGPDSGEQRRHGMPRCGRRPVDREDGHPTRGPARTGPVLHADGA